jgi:ATP-dependent DNA ligase
LQEALGDSGKPEHIVADAFELLHLDGENLTKQPLTERKQTLETLLRKSNPGASLRYSEHVAADGAAMHARAFAEGLEGFYLEDYRRFLRHRPSEIVAEGQMRIATGIYHHRL